MATTNSLAAKLVASAEKAGRPAFPPTDKRFVNALAIEISRGHAPVIREYVAQEIFKALVPLQALMEELEARLAALEK
jgi:hypothetical protein